MGRIPKIILKNITYCMAIIKINYHTVPDVHLIPKVRSYPAFSSGHNDILSHCSRVSYIIHNPIVSISLWLLFAVLPH